MTANADVVDSVTPEPVSAPIAASADFLMDTSDLDVEAELSQQQTEPISSAVLVTATETERAEQTMSLHDTEGEPRQKTSEGLTEHFWRLVPDDGLGLAFHLASAAENLVESALPKAALLRAVALGKRLTMPYGELVRPLAAEMNAIEHSLGEDRWEDENLLLGLAATLRPALLAPQDTGAGIVLRALAAGSSHNTCAITALRSRHSLNAETPWHPMF